MSHQQGWKRRTGGVNTAGSGVIFKVRAGGGETKTVRKTLGKEAPKQSTMSTHNYSWSAGTSTITAEIHYDGFVTTVKQSSTLIQLVRQNRRRAPSDSHGSRPSVTYMSANTTSQKQADTTKRCRQLFQHTNTCKHVGLKGLLSPHVSSGKMPGWPQGMRTDGATQHGQLPCRVE